mgnify:CR=1 FL=1
MINEKDKSIKELKQIIESLNRRIAYLERENARRKNEVDELRNRRYD